MAANLRRFPQSAISDPPGILHRTFIYTIRPVHGQRINGLRARAQL
jgi:hypothetical protein